jgi:hypothetical protein
MSEDIKFEKTVYDKNIYEKLVNTEFTQFNIPITPQEEIEDTPTVQDFFKLYQDLFYQIPQKGEINSHTYLIQQSSEYVNFTPNQQEIEALQNEISQLRQQLLEEQIKTLESQTGETIELPTVQAGSNTAGGTNVISNTSNSY